MKINDFELDKYINNYYDNYDNNINIPNELSLNIKDILHSEVKKKLKLSLILKKIISILLGLSMLSGGFVFAKRNFNNWFNFGNGLETAIKNNYIVEPNVSDTYLESNAEINNITYENILVTTNINAVIMDDLNINSNLEFTFEETIKDAINLKNYKNIILEDLIVTDDKNRILYCSNEEEFNKFCSQNNLNYKYLQFNENYINTGINSFLQSSEKSNTLNLVLNLYTDGWNEKYPSSNNLNYSFSKITLIEDYEKNINDKYITITGNWNLTVNIPSEMKNRKNINYNVISCSNPNFKILTSKATNIGFEVEILISNIEKPKSLKLYDDGFKKRQNNEISSEEWKKIVEETQDYYLYLTPIKSFFETPLGETINDCTYIENENNEKFLISTSPGRMQKGFYIDDNTFEFYETFDLTKFDLTDKLFIHLVCNEEIINIELKRN